MIKPRVICRQLNCVCQEHTSPGLGYREDFISIHIFVQLAAYGFMTRWEIVEG